ncbi:MAG TPA: RNase P subunit p30 family protein [Methanotrichaceae archaeon]|nr:RNase P subunit p30 family protein [Methanotrichaceae archaeon]
MTFYECGLHSLPEGFDSPSRFALAAKRLGYDGIIISNHSGQENLFRPEACQNITNIEIAFGIEVMASNPRSLSSRISSARGRYHFLAVHGGADDINRAACESADVDVLLHPTESRRGLSAVAAKSAQQNQVAIGFDLGPMIRLRGIARSRWLETLSRDLALVRKFNLGMMITTGPWSHLDMRGPREVMALAEMAGLESGEIRDALALPARILELNRKDWKGPGVELL